MASLWHLKGTTWKGVAKRVWCQFNEDDVLDEAAALSFYFFLALFPLLILLTTIFGYFAQSADLRARLLEYLQTALPPTGYSLVAKTIDQVTRQAGGGKLSFGIVATLWAASSGMAAVANGLNKAYGIKDERSWWKTRLVAILLTLASAIAALIGLIFIVAGPKLGGFFAGYLGLQGAFQVFWEIIRWPAALLMVLFAVNLLYRYAPDLKDCKWRWMSPGAVIAVAIWIAASIGFQVYLGYINNYNATYGSLGAVIVLMMWLYLTGIAILTGAEVNAEIENSAARAGDPDARLRGEKRPGERRKQASQRRQQDDRDRFRRTG